MKTVALVDNTVGGIDLLTERDAGNEIMILTGRREKSLEFWKNLREVSEEAIKQLKEETHEG